MKILFCDLCNESVPQSELDAGRAFMRKGRVICLKCDQLMTQREEPSDANPFGGPATQPAVPAPMPQPTLTPVPVPAAAPDAGLMQGQALPAHSHAGVQAAQRSGFGVGLGVFSIALTACGFYWLMERSERVSADMQKRLDSIEQEQGTADKLATARITHYIERIDTPAGALTRLRAGPYATREAAEKALAAVKASALDGQVVPLP